MCENHSSTVDSEATISTAVALFSGFFNILQLTASCRTARELRSPRGFLFLYYPYQHPPVTTSTLPTKVSRGDLLEGAGMFIDPYRVNRLTCCSSAP